MYPKMLIVIVLLLHCNNWKEQSQSKNEKNNLETLFFNRKCQEMKLSFI